MKTRMATERAGEVSREKIIWDFVGSAKDSGFYPGYSERLSVLKQRNDVIRSAFEGDGVDMGQPFGKLLQLPWSRRVISEVNKIK